MIVNIINFAMDGINQTIKNNLTGFSGMRYLPHLRHHVELLHPQQILILNFDTLLNDGLIIQHNLTPGGHILTDLFMVQLDRKQILLCCK